MDGLFAKCPNGLQECVDEVLRLLSEQRYLQETNNELYERLLKTKTSMRHELLQLSNSLSELQTKNKYVEEMQNDPLVEAEYEGIKEAMDAGILQLNQPRYPSTITAAGTQIAERLALQTTINIMRHAEEPDLMFYLNQINGNRHFLFNYFMSFGDAITRIVRSIRTIFKQILQTNMTTSMTKYCDEAVAIVQSLWLPGPSDEEGRSITAAVTSHWLAEVAEKGNRVRKFSMETYVSDKGSRHNSCGGSSNHGQDQPNSLKKKTYVEVTQKYTKEKIISMIISGIERKLGGVAAKKSVRKGNSDGLDKTARQLLQMLHADRLVWVFCDSEKIFDFIVSQMPSQDSSGFLHSFSQSALDNFSQLETIARKECSKKLQEMNNSFQHLIAQMWKESADMRVIFASAEQQSFASTRSLDFLEANIQQVESQRQQQTAGGKDTHTNPRIIQAIENVIRRQQEYFYSINHEKDDNTLASQMVITDQQKGSTSLPTSASLVNPIQSGGGQGCSSIRDKILSTKRNSLPQQQLDKDNPSADDSLTAITDYLASVPLIGSKNSKYVKNKGTNHNMSAVEVSSTSATKKQVGGLVGLSGQGGNGMAIATNVAQHLIQRFSLPMLMVNTVSSANIPVNQVNNSTMSAGAATHERSSLLSDGQVVVSTALGGQNNYAGAGQSTNGAAAATLTGILKKRITENSLFNSKKALEVKSVFDVMEDKFIEEEARRYKARDKLMKVEKLAKEKQSGGGTSATAVALDSSMVGGGVLFNPTKQAQYLSLGSERKSGQSRGRVIASRNSSWTTPGPSVLRQFSMSSKILAKIDRLDKQSDPAQAAASAHLTATLKHEKQHLFDAVVKQSRLLNEINGSSTQANFEYSRRPGEEGGGGEGEGDCEGDSRKADSIYCPRLTYLQSTASQDERKKAALQTIQTLKLNRAKSSLLLDSIGNKFKSQRGQRDLRSGRIEEQHLASLSSFHEQNNRFIAKYSSNGTITPSDVLEETAVPPSRSTNSSSSKQFAFHVPKTASTTKGQKVEPAKKQQQQQQNVSQRKHSSLNNILPSSNGGCATKTVLKADFVDFPYFSRSQFSGVSPSSSSLHQILSPQQHTYSLYSPVGLLTNNNASATHAYQPAANTSQNAGQMHHYQQKI